MRPLDVALAATLHDPAGALARALRRALPALGATYRAVAVTTSPPTAASVNRVLAGAGMYAGTPAANRRGPLYRLALRRALRAGTAHVHYLDFDRVLHWLERAPRELATALRAGTRERVLVLGRTPRAHRSHQRPLHATEVVVNRLIAERAALDAPLDLLVPSFVAARDATRALLERSRARDDSVYGEWAGLLLGLAPEIAYLECRGLEWETPDRHRRAVARAGLAAWRRRWDTPAEWALRTAMAAAFVRGSERVLARAGWKPPSVRRLGIGTHARDATHGIHPVPPNWSRRRRGR